MSDRDWSNCVLLPKATQHSRCWGDNCVVFNPESGDTHAMNKDGLRVLEALQSQPRSFEQLWSISAIATGQGDRLEFGQLLEALEEHDLLEVVQGPDAH